MIGPAQIWLRRARDGDRQAACGRSPRVAWVSVWALIATAASPFPVAAQAPSQTTVALAAAASASKTHNAADSLARAARDSVRRDSVQRAGSPWYRRLPVGERLSGDVVISGEAYAASGIGARRPSAVWRLSTAPQLSLLGGVTVGVSILLSDEEQSLRQNISQLGFSPSWRWATLHLGDFTRGYSQYTTQGLRVRGGGFDLRPGIFRLGMQYGRTQRAVSSLTEGPVYRRNMLAGTIGIGRETGPSLDLTVLHAKDQVSALEHELLVRDTLLDDPFIGDTLPDALRPRPNTAARPQENLVLGLTGRLPLLGRRLMVRGEIAGSALTHDLTAPRARTEQLDDVARAAARLIPLRLSSAGDLAYTGELTFNAARGSLRAGYETIGAGYGSLGLGYVVNDRRTYSLGGSLRGLADRLILQGQYQHQNDNLLGQKTTTTSRDVVTATAVGRLGRSLTTSLTALLNLMSNDAAVDTFAVAMRSSALTATTSLARTLLGRQSAVSLAYGLLRTMDANVVRNTPGVVVHNLSASVQVTTSPTMSVAPTLSGVLTSVDGQPGQRNALLGLRGQGRFLGDRLRQSLNVSHNFSNGRRVSGVTSQTTWALPLDSQLSISARLTSYSAFASRPGFRESFVTTSVARSF